MEIKCTCKDKDRIKKSQNSSFKEGIIKWGSGGTKWGDVIIKTEYGLLYNGSLVYGYVYTYMYTASKKVYFNLVQYTVCNQGCFDIFLEWVVAKILLYITNS